MEPITASLKNRAVRGAKWTSLATVGGAIIEFLQMVALAHLLPPEAFGLMGMVLVVVRFARIFSDMGISNAIIYHRETTTDQLSTLYWVNFLAGFAVYVGLIVLRPAIAALYGEPRLHELMLWAATIFVVVPFGQQFQVLLQKKLEFRRLAFIQLWEALARAVAAILLALQGVGVMSLVVGHIIGALVRAICLFFSVEREWWPRFHFARSDLDGYLGFGLYQLGDKTANFLNTYIMDFIIGSLLGARALGFYTLAFELVFKPTLIITQVLTRVAFPVFAALQEEIHRVKKGYLKVLRLLALINFPLTIGIGVVATTAVPLIYGERWGPSTILVMILAPVAVLRSIGSPVGSLLLSQGRADRGFVWSVAKMGLQIPALYLGALWGNLPGACLAALALQSSFSILAYFVLIHPIFGCCAKEYVQTALPAFWMSIVMAVTVLCLENATATYLSRTLSLVLQISVGIIVYMGLLAWRQRALVNEILDVVMNRPWR